MPHSGSILVVDNDPTIVDLLVDLLTDEGYVVYSAPDGAGAFASIAQHPPELILLDMRMPGMSAAELIARVREIGLVTLPLVLLTTSLYDAEPLVVLGLIECLAKPFDIDDLLACVARYVRTPYAKAKSLARGDRVAPLI